MRSSHINPQPTLHWSSLPFYLVLFLTSVATAEQVILSDGLSVLGATSSYPVISMGDLNEIPVSNLVSKKARRQRKRDRASNSFVQRHLSQVPIQTSTEGAPVVVTKHVPDQIIDIGAQFTYDVSNVFSGDYRRLQATNLPNWLNLEYKQLGSYQANSTATAEAMAVSGNTVFMANGIAGLVILNVSEPSNPKLLSIYPAGEGKAEALGVEVSDNIVFVSNYFAGLLTLNVSDLSNPQLLSTYPGEAWGSILSGNTLFVAGGDSGLKILNVSNLSAPQLLGTYPAGNGSAWRVAVSGNTVFVANARAGLLILNVSDLSDPQLLSTYPAGNGAANGVVVWGNTVFVANYVGGVLILNVSDLSDPILLSTYPAGRGFALELVILDNILYVANGNGILFVDVSDPSDPHLFATYPGGSGKAWGIAASSKHVFLANGITGLEIPDYRSASLAGTPYDVRYGKKWKVAIAAQDSNGSLIMDTFQLTADSVPQLVKNTLTDQSIFPNEPFVLPLESQQLFSAPNTSFLGFSLYQKSNPVLPDWLALETKPTMLSVYPAGAHVVAVSDNTAFVATREEGLLILDVKDLANPQLLSIYPAGSGLTMAVAVSGNVVFVANFDAVLILNGSDPSNLRLLGTYPASGEVWWVTISGNNLFVSTLDALLILNVSDLSNPRLLSTYPIDDEGFVEVVVSGDIVFAAAGFEGLLILNVSDLSNPQLLSYYPAGIGDAWGVAISGNTVFVTAGEAGLLILNVSDLSDPQLLATYPASGGRASGVALLDNTVYIGNEEGGLLLVNVSDPSSPQLFATYPAGSGVAYGVRAYGNTVFLANGDAGLHILSDSNKWQLKIKATPSLADAGNYPLMLRTNDQFGASISIPFTLRVEGSPRVNSNVTWRYAEIGGKPFTFHIPADTFKDPNFDPLVLNLIYANQTALPVGYWLTFNPLAAVLVGQPRLRETSALRLVATDPSGNTAFTDFNLTVVDAPQTILGQPFLWVQNRPLNHTVPLETIFDGAGQPFTYTLVFSDQDESASEWLNHTFSGTNLTLWGTPCSSGKVTLTISATALEYQTSTPFVLSINPNYPPHTKQAISAQTATVWSVYGFVLPLETFEDINEDPLHYTAMLVDGTPLPNWLTFSQDEDPNNEGSWRFSGIPGGWDTNPVWSRTMTVQVTAYDPDNASAVALFNLTVNGTSIIGLILGFVGPILTVLGFYKSILNRVCYKRYQKSDREIEVGKPFGLRLSTPRESVGYIEVRTCHVLPKGYGRFIDVQRFFMPPINYLQFPFDPLPEGTPLPEWMKYKKHTNILEGVLPPDICDRELIVRVKDHSGIVREQFALNIEGATLNQEDEENPQLARPALTQRSNRQHVGRLGSVNGESDEIGYEVLK